MNDGTGNYIAASAAPLTTTQDWYADVAFGDLDNDGDHDLVIVAGTTRTYNRYYINNGATSMVATSGQSIHDGAHGTTSAAWGDYDNDGDLDLLVGNRDALNELHRNDAGVSDRVFTLISTSISGYNSPYGSAFIELTSSVAWADLDGDSDLDAIIGNTRTMVSSYRVGGYNELHHNLGGDTFVLVTQNLPSSLFIPFASPSSGIGEPAATAVGDTYKVAPADYDNDGDVDILFAGTMNSKSVLWINQGNWRFGNAFALWGGADVSALLSSQDAVWGDLDNDGDLDFVSCGSNSASHKIMLNNLIAPSPTATSGEAFSPLSGNFPTLPGYDGQSVEPNSLDLGDYNDDGVLDILIGTADNKPNRLLDGTLASSSFSYTAVTPSLNSGATSPCSIVTTVTAAVFVTRWADVDGDGDLDACFFTGSYPQANGGGTGTPSANILFRNDGQTIINGQSVPAFTQMTSTNSPGFAPILAAGDRAAASWVDVDRDGDLDLFFGNRGSTNELWMQKTCTAGARVGTSSACHTLPGYARMGAISDIAYECSPHWSGSPNPIRCQTCPPGFQRPLGGDACVKCQEGYAQLDGEATACLQCGAGKYSNFNGSVLCFDCAMGSHAPSPGTSTCSACPIGTFSAAPGSSVCSPCPVGRQVMSTRYAYIFDLI